jgi:hypothetical protein
MKRMMAILLVVMSVVGVASIESAGKKEVSSPVTTGTAPASEAETSKAKERTPDTEAASGASRWKGKRSWVEQDKGRNAVRFYEKDGKLHREMKLRKDSQIGKPPSKFERFRQAPPDTKMSIRDEQKAYLSPMGEYVAVVTEDYVEVPESPIEGEVKLTIYSSDGKAIWETNEMILNGRPLFTGDGQRVFIHMFRSQGGEHQKGKQWILVYNLPQRKVERELEDFPEKVSLSLSPSGKYLALNGGPSQNKLVFYNLDSGRRIERQEFFHTKLFDNGTVELYKRQNNQDILVDQFQMP